MKCQSGFLIPNDSIDGDGASIDIVDENEVEKERRTRRKNGEVFEFDVEGVAEKSSLILSQC